MNLKNELNVLQIVTGLGVGGAERVVVELTSKMITNGYNVEVISLNDDISLLKQYPNVNFKLTSLGMTKTVGSFFSALGHLNRFVNQKNITVIHAHMFHSLMFSLLVKLLNPRINVVFTSHSYGGFGRLRSFLIKLTKKNRNTDIVFDNNQHTELNSMKTVVIKNSVNVPSVPIRNKNNNNNTVEETKFLFLGRLDKPKNPVNMIYLFSKMKNDKSHLIIAGDGYLRGDVERAIMECALQDRVELLGVVNDVPTLLANVDCLVMPSLWEGLPMVILEAGARSLPVISTPVGSIPELLSDDCGYLCDASEFTETLDFVASNLQQAKFRGENLYHKVKAEYSLANMMKKHLEVYISVQSVTK
jgi:glycosyltransferase involved in cell wall biosynthesis